MKLNFWDNCSTGTKGRKTKLMKGELRLAHTMFTFSLWIDARDEQQVWLYASEESSKEGTWLMARFIHKIKAKL